MLGRETAIQPVEWPAGGWPSIAGGVPADEVPAPDLPEHPWPAEPATDHFDEPAAGHRLVHACAARPRRTGSTWRTRPSHLRIYGGQSPVGKQTPSLVARRVGATRCSLETELEFDPANHRQLAGITGYYNTAELALRLPHPRRRRPARCWRCSAPTAATARPTRS